MVYRVKINKRDKIHISKGNKKLGTGIYTFNTLPGDDYVMLKNGDAVCDVKGTCGGCCDDCKEKCYAIKGLKAFYSSVAPANGENTLIMREKRKEGMKMIRDYVLDKGVKVFRWHSSGEIMDLDYLKGMVWVAEECKDCTFYFYTKRFDLIKEWVRERRNFPENLVCNLSEWNGNLDGWDEKVCFNKFKFVEDGSKEEGVYCPGYKGVTCDNCGLCWKNHRKTILVKEH